MEVAGGGAGARQRVTFDCRFAAESHSQINLQVFSPSLPQSPNLMPPALQALNEEYFGTGTDRQG